MGLQQTPVRSRQRFVVIAVALGTIVAVGPVTLTQAPVPRTTWTDYGGSLDSAKYSTLTQITRDNVSQLRPAWTYPTYDNTAYHFGPIVVDDVAYVLARNNSLVALDAKTGNEIWIHAELQRHGAARHQLLGKPGPQRSAAAVPAQQLSSRRLTRERASRS